MDIAEIKKHLAKPATKFIAGGFRPTDSEDESWLGRVFLFRPEESVPTNAVGKQLLPLAQFHIPRLPFVPSSLSQVRVLSVFISEPFPEPFEEMGNNWVIREYAHNELLVRKELPIEHSYLKPFPLKSTFVPEDYPLWDGGGIPTELETEILCLENKGEIESYYDFVCHTYEHKIGGYPSFCQSGVDPREGFEFVFQVSSDAKINLNVIDSGSLMFWKHRNTGKWAIYYDFY
jgi:Domain of unknown function (DUF1963)